MIGQVVVRTNRHRSSHRSSDNFSCNPLSLQREVECLGSSYCRKTNSAKTAAIALARTREYISPPGFRIGYLFHIFSLRFGNVNQIRFDGNICTCANSGAQASPPGNEAICTRARMQVLTFAPVNNHVMPSDVTFVVILCAHAACGDDVIIYDVGNFSSHVQLT